MAARLPKKVDFGVAVINIKQVSVSEMKDLLDDDYDPDIDGFWDVDTETIYIRKALPLKKKREVLFHELVHAAVDNNYWARYQK